MQRAISRPGVHAALQVALLAVSVAAPARTFDWPLRLEQGRTCVWAAVGRFRQGASPGFVLVHGNNRVTILEPAGAGREDWESRAIEPVGLALQFVRAVDVDKDGDDDILAGDTELSGYLLRSRGDGQFEDPVAIGGNFGPRTIVVGDWDEDGAMDLATVNHPTPTVSVHMGNGDGTFADERLISIGSEHHNHDLDVLDFDLDGHQDLMLCIDFQGVQLLRGKGDGTFARGPMIGTPDQDVVFASSADLDGDGPDDVLVLTRGEGLARAAYRDASGTYKWTYSESQVACMPARLDLDGDGKLDLVSVLREGGGLRVHMGKGDGSFESPKPYPLAATWSVQSFAADVDLDGIDDLVILDSAVQVIWGKATAPYLSLGSSLDGVETAVGLAAGDLDGNGSPDVFLSRVSAGVYLNPGGASRTTPSLWISGTQPIDRIEVADLDGDGVPDLAGTNAAGSLIVEFLDKEGKSSKELVLPTGSVPGPVIAARVDGNDTIDLLTPCRGADQVTVFFNEGARSFSAPLSLPVMDSPVDAAVGDFDRDGHLDIAASSSQEISVCFGKGAREFETSAPALADPTRRFQAIEAADMDADGAADIVVSLSASPGMRCLVPKPGRTFEALTPVSLGASSAMAVGDLDGSGWPDVVLSMTAQGISVLVDPLRVPAAATETYALSFRPTALRIVDLDLDGGLDLLALGRTGVTVLSGKPRTSGPFLRGDANGDGALNITDAINVLNGLFLGAGMPPCLDSADSNDDGKVDLTDPVATLLHLFQSAGSLPPPGPESCGADPSADELGPCPPQC